MFRHTKEHATAFISFSGVDGAGKSTQIEALRRRMEKDGLRVKLITFWDDIALLTRFRETAGHRIFKGEKGVGTPSSPINRQDKNIQSPWMTMVRLILYGIDAISTRYTVKKALRTDIDLVIFDRYVYDELANLSPRNPIIRAYIRFIVKLIPEPCIRFLLDADPIQARLRKPEYPLEFLYINRHSYLVLSDLIGGFTIISPMPIHEVELSILEHTRECLLLRHFGHENRAPIH